MEATGMRMSELSLSSITCRGLQVDTLDRLPTTILKKITDTASVLILT